MTSPKIYTTQFWLLCVSALLFFASFNMIIPELPAFLTSLGGAEHKGFIISLFTLTAMISRPFSGSLADKIGRVPVMMFGSAVCLLCSFVYPVLTTVSGFLLLRLVHGFSTGFTPTGQTAYLSDVIPAHRRGEAMGLLGTAGSVGMACGPAIGGTIANKFGIDAMFYMSSAFGLVSILVLIGIRETVTKKQRMAIGLLKVRVEDLFEPRVLVPCIIMGLSAYAYGTAYTVLADFGEFVGIKNKGLLFAYLTVSSLTVRLVGGKASDRWGRRKVLRISTALMAVATLVIGLATSRLQLIIGISLYGFSHGATSPTLLAWAADLSDPLRKGRGVSSLYIFMELGIGIGALCSGFIYGNESGNFLLTFAIPATLALIAFLFLLGKYSAVQGPLASQLDK